MTGGGLRKCLAMRAHIFPTPIRRRQLAPLGALLWWGVAACGWAWGQEAALPDPGAQARLVAGRVLERLTGPDEERIQRELWPDRPFSDPLPSMSSDDLRRFRAAAHPAVELSATQLAALRPGGENAAAGKALVEAARGWADAEPGAYAPCRHAWTERCELCGEVEGAAARLVSMRRQCALAYAVSGEARFARASWAAMLAQMRQFHTYGAFRRVYSWEAPWDEAQELFDAAAAWDLLAGWGGLSPADYALMMNYLRRLGGRVAYAVEISPVADLPEAVLTCHLGVVAQAAPGLPEAAAWRKLVDYRLDSVMSGFAPDGGHDSLSGETHALVLRALCRLAVASALSGDASRWQLRGGQWGSSLETALDWMAQVATPLGELPALGNTRRLELAGLGFVWQAAAALGRGDWVTAFGLDPARTPVAATELAMPVAHDPGTTAVLLPESGLGVLRDGWGREDGYLALRFGGAAPEGDHADRLSFEMYANGQPWVLDAGAPPEGAEGSTAAAWAATTAAHNTVQVDGGSQEPTTGAAVAWFSVPACDVLAAEQAGYPELIQRRTVFHPRRGYTLICDEVVNLSGRERALTWLGHVNGRRESGTTGRFVFWREGRQGLSVVVPTEAGLRGVDLREGPCTGAPGFAVAPLPDGTMPWVPGGDGWGNIPCIALHKTLKANDRTTYWVLLAPFKGPEPAISFRTVETTEVLAAEVRLGALRDRLVMRRRDAGRGVVRALGLATDGQYGFVRETNGDVTALEVLGGDSLSIQ